MNIEIILTSEATSLTSVPMATPARHVCAVYGSLTMLVIVSSTSTIISILIISISTVHINNTTMLLSLR